MSIDQATLDQVSPKVRAALSILATRHHHGEGPAQVSTTTDPALGLINWRHAQWLVDQGWAEASSV